MTFIFVGRSKKGKTFIFNGLTGREDGPNTSDWISFQDEVVDTPSIESVDDLNTLLNQMLFNNITVCFVMRYTCSVEEINMCHYISKKYNLILILNNVLSNNLPSYKILNIYDENISDVEKELKIIKRSIEMPIAIIGRENSGKSSLMNELLNIRRVKVEDKLGTTQNFVEHLWKNFIICDTPGFNNKKNHNQEIINGLSNIQGAVIVIDANHGLTNIDKYLLNIPFGFWTIVAINKTDIIQKWKFQQVNIPRPFCYISCKENNVIPVKNLIIQSEKMCQKVISTNILNNWMKKQKWKMFDVRHKECRISFIKQTSILPTTFKYFSSFPLYSSYEKFLVKKIKTDFYIENLNIKLIWCEK